MSTNPIFYFRFYCTFVDVDKRPHFRNTGEVLQKSAKPYFLVSSVVDVDKTSIYYRLCQCWQTRFALCQRWQCPHFRNNGEVLPTLAKPYFLVSILIASDFWHDLFVLSKTESESGFCRIRQTPTFIIAFAEICKPWLPLLQISAEPLHLLEIRERVCQ